MPDSKGPRVSVIIPCYNGESFISDSIRSVLSQTMTEFELIVLNDGSTDGSEDVILGFEDPRIVYVAKENSGVSDTRNQGIVLARAPYVSFLDADDVFEPENLELKVRYLDENHAVGLVHSSLAYFDETGPLRIEERAECVGDVLGDLLGFRTMVNGGCSTAVVRRDVLEASGYFDERLSTSADRDLWIRIAALTEFGYIPKPLARYRRHQGQMHANIDAMEHDLRIIYTKARRAGSFENEAHYHRSRAQMERVLTGSYLRHTSNWPKVGLHLGRYVYHLVLSRVPHVCIG